MELLNEMGRAKNAGAFGTAAWAEAVDIYLRMLAPVCPHIAEELWERLGKPYSIHTQPWPSVDEEAAKEEQLVLVVQVNGKLRDRILVAPGISDDEARAAALGSEAVQQAIEGKPVRKVIIVPGKLVNLVV
jgi:leucyl-tRNA synthetase